jgi:hypothetical protein
MSCSDYDEECHEEQESLLEEDNSGEDGSKNDGGRGSIVKLPRKSSSRLLVRLPLLCALVILTILLMTSSKRVLVGSEDVHAPPVLKTVETWATGEVAVADDDAFPFGV